MRQAVISAVYVDLDSKTAYANYIVISGVQKIEMWLSIGSIMNDL